MKDVDEILKGIQSFIKNLNVLLDLDNSWQFVNLTHL